MRKAISFFILVALFLLPSCSLNHKATEKPREVFKKMDNIKDGEESQITHILDRHWKLVEINGKLINSDNNKEPYILLSKEDNRISGTGGCNGFSGSFEIKEHNRIQFTHIAATQMACIDMETDALLYKVLETADNYTLNGDTLTLNRARMAPLARFIAVDQYLQNDVLLNGDWELSYISGTEITFDNLFPNKKPILTFSLPETRVSGIGGCNRFTSAIKIDGNNINFGEIASTRMFCEGDGESTFFKTLQTVNKYSVSSDNSTLTLIAGDIAVMHLARKQQNK